MSDKAELVEQIKGIQRADADAKQAWWSYCDSQLGGVRDPNRHDVHALQDFLNTYPQYMGLASSASSGRSSGVKRSAPSWGYGYEDPSQMWNYFQQMMGGSSMGEFVKMGQRKSANWQKAWQAYCSVYGTGFNDPSKYDESFVAGFADYVGQLACADLDLQAAEAKLSGKRPAGGYQPPAKRGRPITNGPEGGKAALVEKVKSLQRSSQDTKAAWWAFCDQNAEGIKDPNKHDASSLQMFLSGYE